MTKHNTVPAANRSRPTDTASPKVEPTLERILKALEDPDCRAIIEQLEEPKNATQLSEACSIPQSTIYRKLALLEDDSLITKYIDIKSNGQHTGRYVPRFDEIRIGLQNDCSISVGIERPPRDTRNEPPSGGPETETEL